MKTIKLNNENVVVTLNQREIITICTALSNRSVKLLKENNFDTYFEVKDIYNKLFEYQF